jgi:hypothetical protein
MNVVGTPSEETNTPHCRIVGCDVHTVVAKNLAQPGARTERPTMAARRGNAKCYRPTDRRFVARGRTRMLLLSVGQEHDRPNDVGPFRSAFSFCCK